MHFVYRKRERQTIREEYMMSWMLTGENSSLACFGGSTHSRA